MVISVTLTSSILSFNGSSSKESGQSLNREILAFAQVRIFLYLSTSVIDSRVGISAYMEHYNNDGAHLSLKYRTPKSIRKSHDLKLA